jgi:hypothetical protein
MLSPVDRRAGPAERASRVTSSLLSVSLRRAVGETSRFFCFQLENDRSVAGS